MTRALGNLRILEQFDIIGRTSELSRLFGIQFLEVMTRGSQFRVESIMLRLVRARNFIPVSPSIKQRAKMRAPEYLPLVMEPESRFYGKNDPVVVLDFQSLYPSIIMAYNYCYSTCLGRIVEILNKGGVVDPETKEVKHFEFGCTRLKVSPQRLSSLMGHINFSPGGIGFIKANVQKGIIPIMLEEIIKTRLMVKRAMKLYTKLANSNDESKGSKMTSLVNRSLQKVLHARQLGLKLIANVTYGYTSANFSGRMPCIEVGDSVVSKARETLERAINLLEGNPKWTGARVVYGDTDSVFVVLPGRTKEQAFEIGQQMADAVTMDNPKPVKLKFEKVYMPCILQTKKRYVGYMYENPKQLRPTFDAKGIETVRRDGCPAGAKILEKSLRILFETQDASFVKQFVQHQFNRIMTGNMPLQDLTFAREFRGMSGYKPGACVPALELARRALRLDRMAIPPSGWRVPYVVIYGEPGRPLIHSVKSPADVIQSSDATVRPNSNYYVNKVIIPILSRCLALAGLDVESWFRELPVHKGRIRLNYFPSMGGNKGGPFKSSIPKYFASRICVVCEKTTITNPKAPPICDSCSEDPQEATFFITNKIVKYDKARHQLQRICRSCSVKSIGCVNTDCPVFYALATEEANASDAQHLHVILNNFTNALKIE